MELTEAQKKQVEEVRECQVCGHKGTDAEWQVNPYYSGYFCKDTDQCFRRFSEQRNKPKWQSG